MSKEFHRRSEIVFCLFQELILGDLRADNPELDVTYKIALKTHQKAILRFSLEEVDWMVSSLRRLTNEVTWCVSGKGFSNLVI
jgi:hypothetical protein